MITSQSSMSSVQSGIGLYPMTNPRSVFSPSPSIPLGSTVMPSIVYHFVWNWNSGVSPPTINPIGSAPLPSGLPYPRGNNVSSGLPFLGRTKN